MLTGSALQSVLEDFDVDVYREGDVTRLVYSCALAGEGASLDDATHGLFEALMQLHETFEKMLAAIRVDEGRIKN